MMLLPKKHKEWTSAGPDRTDLRPSAPRCYFERVEKYPYISQHVRSSIVESLRTDDSESFPITPKGQSTAISQTSGNSGRTIGADPHCKACDYCEGT